MLRRAIVTVQIAPDEPLEEAQLMARFRLGRTPLREALKRLAQEQFIVWPPHRSPYVRTFSLDDLHALYETRFLLEVRVAGLAAERLTPDELAGLDALLERFAAVNASGRLYESVELDHELHLAIARCTHNRYLAEAVNGLNCGSLRLWYRAHREVGLEEVTARHRELVEPLRRHDPTAAEAAAHKHIAVSLQRQLSIYPSVFERNGAIPKETR